MKISKLIKVFFLATVAFFASCDEDDDLYPQLGNDPRSISEIISETGDLSTLSAAMMQTSVDSLLRVATTYTMFAPNNAAFAGIDLSGVDEDGLENILMNHVFTTVIADFASTLSTGYITTLAYGPDGTNLNMYLSADSGISLNGMGTVVNGSADIGATNGVLHVVDGVLMPPTIVDHVNANPNYSLFAQAIELAGLADDLAVSDPEMAVYPFTLLAPTNAAMETFLAQLNGAYGWSSLADVPTDLLGEIIMHHVIAEENLLSTDINGTEPVALDGNSLSINADGYISDGTYDSAAVVLADIQGVNGVVHGINKVLLTDAVFQDVLSNSLNFVERLSDRGYTTFLQAASKAGMLESLASENFTGFIPSNDAFTLFFLGIQNYGSIDDFQTEEDIAVLKSLLEYHLYSGMLYASDLSEGQTIATVYGEDITYDGSKLVPSFEEGSKAEIMSANIGSTNGVLHQINRVLIPEGLVSALGIEGAGGLQPVADNAFVYFNFNGEGYDSWWGDVSGNPVTDAATSADGTPFFDASGVQGSAWTGLFFRNSGDNFTPAAIGTDLDAYEFKFDINVKQPATGVIKFRFAGTIGDVFYDWDISQIEEAGWVTVVVPANILGVSDFSLVDGEFGAAYSGDSMLNFSIDNVRFEEATGGIEPVADDAYEYFNFNGDGYDSWWGDVAGNPVTDAANSADGTPFFHAAGVQGSSWTALFFRNTGDNFAPAAIGTDIASYAFKFDINVAESFTDGVLKFRFEGSGGDVFYDWDATQVEGGSGWVTVTVPASLLGVSDFSLVDGEFGVAYSGTSMLNFSMDNLRFEKL